jgi:excisionase family DNA binding protein
MKKPSIHRKVKAVKKTNSLLITVAELARRWAISAPHAYKMVDAGVIQSFRIGHAIRVPIVAVEAYERAQGLDLPTGTDAA